MSKFTSNIDYLRQYVNGELTPTQMYEIERAMHEDEMLMDIIEGLETEKALKIANPSAELQAKIRAKTEPKRESKVIPFRKFFIAASIIAILSIGALYIFTPSPINNQLATSAQKSAETSPLENKVNVSPNVDTTLIAYSEPTTDKGEERPANKIKNREVINSTKEKESLKDLMVYNAKPKMQVVIEGPRYLNKEKEEIIELGTKGESKQWETELLTAKIGNAYQRPTSTNSIAKAQADLQRLDLDPQTKSALNAVLTRQAQENANANTVTKEKQSETSLEEVLTGGNALTNKKSSESTILSSTETYGNITIKPIQNGSPSIGWAQFNTYIKNQLAQKGFKKYSLNISFDLDEAHKPTNIKINSSTNSNVNKHIITFLRQGTTWEGKDPNHPIFIRLSSEEASN